MGLPPSACGRLVQLLLHRRSRRHVLGVNHRGTEVLQDYFIASTADNTSGSSAERRDTTPVPETTTRKRPLSSGSDDEADRKRPRPQELSRIDSSYLDWTNLISPAITPLSSSVRPCVQFLIVTDSAHPLHLSLIVRKEIQMQEQAEHSLDAHQDDH